MSISESMIKHHICKDLEKRGFIPVLQIKTNLSGIADVLVLSGEGKCFFIEVKRHDGIESQIQKYRKKVFQEKGYKRYVVYSYQEYLDIFK